MDLLRQEESGTRTGTIIADGVEADEGLRSRLFPPAPADGLARSLERKRLQCYLFLLVGDIALLLATFLVATVLYYDVAPTLQQLDGGMRPVYLMLPLYLTIAIYNGTYSRSGLTDAKASSGRMLAALLISAALLNFMAFFAKMNADFSRLIFTSSLVAAAILMIVFRAAFARWLASRWGPSPLNRLVIHAGGPKFTLPHAYHVDAAEHGLRPDMADPVSLDRLAKYLLNMDEIVVSCAEQDRLNWAEVLKGSGRHGEIVSEFSRRIGALGVVHHDSAKISTLLVSKGHLGLRARVFKRLFDIAVSAAALVALSPLMGLVALAIKMHDGGPVLFRQRRMGRGNRFFDIYKFRSMRVADADGNRSASKDDDRITPIGRLIRCTSIDELPQLINVLKGDMSLVGPRPHALGSRAGDKLFWQVDRKYWQRHGLRPGITGLAQVRGYRGATDCEDDLKNRLQADLEYIRDWSLWGDIKILCATLSVLVHERAF